MNIAVINGSPKGENSVTIQYIRYIGKHHPSHQFQLLNVSNQIRQLEKDSNKFRQTIDAIRQADGVIWAFPLYVFLVPAQYKRFIEMIWERDAAEAFQNKYAAALSTSIHFFDHTAHAYIQGICDDLGMNFTESYSADMDDLLLRDQRPILLKWADRFLQAVTAAVPTDHAYSRIEQETSKYTPGKAGKKMDAGGLKISVVADWDDAESNIAAMVKRFAGAFKEGVAVWRLQDIPMQGGCLGCIECGFDNLCVYKDGFVDFFNREIRDADVVIYAGAVKDRFLSSRMKMFWDRRFFKGHIPLHTGKQTGYLISGPLAQLPNLREILLAGAELSGANLTGIVTDESNNARHIDALIDHFAARCLDNARDAYVRPRTFLGVGGHKIFRDEIWARLRFPFEADFRFFEHHGLFDFPQDDTRYLERNKQMIELIRDPRMREVVRKMIKTEMIKGYADVVKNK